MTQPAPRPTVCLSFDNLGEAAELEAGIWPRTRKVGRHYSVEEGLPWVLKTLGSRPATFFIEGWSAKQYPSAVASIAAAAKEVGLHGWRHEQWKGVGSQERELLVESVVEFDGLGIKTRGFRPPGGPMTPAGIQFLASAR